MKNELIALANYLDDCGAEEEADLVDKLLQSYPADATVLVIAPQKEKCECVDKKDDEKKSEAADFSDMLGKLANIADTLDNAGLVKEASTIDDFIQKTAKDVVDWKENTKSEQSKRYDAKFHHEQQIFDPKKPTPSVEKHHVETYQQTGKPLSARHCENHIGASLMRIGDGIYQCSIGFEIFNFEETGSVAGQTPSATQYEIPSRIFDSREVNINRVN